MYCMQVCDSKKTLYGLPLEPLPSPAVFDDCADEDCASDDVQTGRGCLFDAFDPDTFNRPCCKSGCCAICARIGDDAPYLVPHVISCMEPWPYAASSCSQGTGRCRNHRIRLRINPLPACSCSPTNEIFHIPGQPLADCDRYPYSASCCIVPRNGTQGYQVLCIRVRGVPSIEFEEPAGSTISYVNDPQGYYLYARPTLHLEILLRDCCGYLFTVKSSYRMLNSMLLAFPLHCRLCDLGEASIYLKTKVQLCEPSVPIIMPDGSGMRMFDFQVNLSVDACVIKHVPYDSCNAATACLPSLVNGSNNISDPENALALDAPYLVPFPIACRRIRAERVMSYGPDGVPTYECVPVGVTLPPTANLPGVGPWTVVEAGSVGQTDVVFDDCLPGPCPPGAYLPCLTPRACCEKHRENCESHTLEATLRAHMSLTLRDSLGDIYPVVVDIDQPFNINLGTAWRHICRAWLYVKTKFSMCGERLITTGGYQSLPIDTLIEACVMKLIPYQITGRDPHCNLGPWYYRDYCRDGFRENCAALPNTYASGAPGESVDPDESGELNAHDPGGASAQTQSEPNAAVEPEPNPSLSAPDYPDPYGYYPDDAASAALRAATARPIRDPIPLGCRQNRR
ncbi:MAG: hypothetical protein LBH66_00725 [Oscillospiraceae bacterium]|nr:hypothetical protein [Oscillospiraceae bacterium]